MADDSAGSVGVEEQCGNQTTPGTQDTRNYEDHMFVSWVGEFARRIHQTAVDKGFWEGERNDGEMIALIHSELSECLEAIRHDNPPDAHCPGFSSAEVELADAVIRIMDMAAGRGWRLGEAIVAKMRYNATRPPKHGKKF